MREIVSLYIGQPGIQIALPCWEQYISEHYIDYNGRFNERNNSSYSKLHSLFCESSLSTYTPRAGFFDGDTEIALAMQRNKLRHLFNKDFCLTNQSESGSLWPRAYNVFNESSSEIIRRLMEQCDSVAGIMIYHSPSGGYGGGFTSKILSYLDQNCEKTQKLTISIFPSDSNLSSLDQSQTEPYNSILTLQNFPLTDYNIILENSALRTSYTYHNPLKLPTFNNLNQLIAQLSSSLTYTMRFGGEKIVDLFDLKKNMSFYAKQQFYWAAMSNNQECDMQKQDYNLKNIFERLFDRRGALLEYSLKQNCFFSSTFFIKGNYVMKDLSKVMKMMKESNSIQFINQQQKNFILSLKKGEQLQKQQNKNEISVCQISNSTAILRPLISLNQRFKKLYSKKSFLHWYLNEGLEQMNLLEAQEELLQYQGLYQYQNNFTKVDKIETMNQEDFFELEQTKKQYDFKSLQNFEKQQLQNKKSLNSKVQFGLLSGQLLKNNQIKQYNEENSSENINNNKLIMEKKASKETVNLRNQKQQKRKIDEKLLNKQQENNQKNQEEYNFYNISQIPSEEEEFIFSKQNLNEIRQENNESAIHQSNNDQNDFIKIDDNQNKQQQVEQNNIKKDQNQITNNQSEELDKQGEFKKIQDDLKLQEKQLENNQQINLMKELDSKQPFSNSKSNSILKRACQYFENNQDYSPNDIGSFVFEYCKLISNLGKILYFALTDIRDKAQIILDRGNEYQSEAKGIFKIIEIEKQRSLHNLNGTNNKEIRKNNTLANYISLARTIQRILWFFDFLTLICDDIWRNRDKNTTDICQDAYNQSLAKYHNYLIQTASKAACLAAPSRLKIFEAFAPQQSEEQAYISIKELVDLLNPIKENIKKFYLENQLNELP